MLQLMCILQIREMLLLKKRANNKYTIPVQLYIYLNSVDLKDEKKKNKGEATTSITTMREP